MRRGLGHRKQEVKVLFHDPHECLQTVGSEKIGMHIISLTER